MHGKRKIHPTIGQKNCFREILWRGCNSADVILMRHNEDGSIDSSFGGHGARKFLLHLEHDFLESGDIEPCPAVQSDGKVIVITKQNALNFPIFRYHDDGSLDRSFGAEGTISFTTYLGHPLLNAYLLADDKIMFLTGDPRNANLRHVNCRTRNGLPDTEWSAEGAATITLPFPLHITCSAIQGNGDIILGGFDRKNPDSHARLFRYRKLNALEEAEREAQETIVRGEQALKSWWTSLMHIESDEICPICQDELAIKTIVETPCNHFFHRECLEGWLANDQHTCPMCRENFGDWRLPAE